MLVAETYFSVQSHKKILEMKFPHFECEASQQTEFAAGMLRGVLITASVIAIGVLVEGGSALAGVKFTVEYDWVATEVKNNELIRNHHKTDYWLAGHNLFKYTDNFGEHLVPLGSEGAIVNQAGDQGTVQIRVVGGRIQYKAIYPGRAMSIDISSNGANSCHASIIYYKLEGQEFFEHHGIKKVTPDSNEHAENVTCAISETPD